MQILRPYPDPLNQEFWSVSQQAVFLKVSFDSDIHSKFKNHPPIENQLVSCVRSTSCGDVCCYRPILNPRPLVRGRVSVPYYRSKELAQWESICLQCRRHGGLQLDPWVGKIPWRRKWQSTTVFLSGESHAQQAWWAQVHMVAEIRIQLKLHSTQKNWIVHFSEWWPESAHYSYKYH